MNRSTVTLSLLIALGALGCSNQWRESNPAYSSSDVVTMLGEAQTASAQSTTGGTDGISLAMTLKDDPNTTIYFASAPDSDGPVASVLGLASLDFLGGPQGLDWTSVSAARIFFLDSPSLTDRQDALVIGIAMTGAPASAKAKHLPLALAATTDPTMGVTTGTTDPTTGTTTGTTTPTTPTGPTLTYYGFSGTSSVSDGTFEAVLTGPTGATIVLRSDDVDGDSLNDVIQLRVYDHDAAGNEEYIGAFSTLTGFAHQ